MSIRIPKALRTNRKVQLATLVAIIIVIVGIWQLFFSAPKKASYQTATVTKGTLISTVNESGNVTSSSQAGVGSPTTGIVTDLYVKDGDTVTQGQNLFKVKSIASAQEIASAWAAYQSSLNSANSASDSKTVNQSTLEKDRATILSAVQTVTNMQNSLSYNPATKNAYTQNEIDAINSALTSARETFTADELKYNQTGQNISAASASVNSAWLAYQATQDSVVTAPIGGTVANIALKAGDQVTASAGNLSSNQTSNSSTSTSSSSNAILSIGNYSTPYVKVQASEVDITNIKAGQKATITLSAFPTQTFVGSVDQVDTAGTVSSGVVTYNVFITFVAPPSTIKPGMSATVTIQTARKDDVLSVPSTAIQTSSGQATVEILQNGTPSSVAVGTGITSDTDTEITSGLSEGETIITGTISSAASAASGASPFSGIRGAGGFGGGAVRGGGGGGGGTRGG